MNWQPQKTIPFSLHFPWFPIFLHQILGVFPLSFAVAAVAAVVGRQLQPARLATFGRQVRHAADAARQLGQLDVLPRLFDNL